MHLNTSAYNSTEWVSVCLTWLSLPSAGPRGPRGHRWWPLSPWTRSLSSSSPHWCWGNNTAPQPGEALDTSLWIKTSRATHNRPRPTSFQPSAHRPPDPLTPGSGNSTSHGCTPKVLKYGCGVREVTQHYDVTLWRNTFAFYSRVASLRPPNLATLKGVLKRHGTKLNVLKHWEW